MSCPALRMKNKGSGYVKESTGNTELNKHMTARLAAMLAERDAQVNAIFHPPPPTDTPILKHLTIRLMSLALDRLVAEPAQRGVRYTTATTPDWDHVRHVVWTHLDDKGIENASYIQPIHRGTTQYEVALFVSGRWGACVVYVEL